MTQPLHYKIHHKSRKSQLAGLTVTILGRLVTFGVELWYNSGDGAAHPIVPLAASYDSHGRRWRGNF